MNSLKQDVSGQVVGCSGGVVLFDLKVLMLGRNLELLLREIYNKWMET